MTPKAFDLAIVGAGIVGTCTAYYASLTCRDWRIVLLEKSAIGNGATRYSLALDLPFGKTPRLKLLVEESTHRYHELKSRDSNFPIHQIPFSLVVRTQDIDRIAASFVDNQLHLADYQEQLDVQACYPGLRIPQGYRILLGANARYGIPQAAASSLVRKAAIEAHVECCEGTEVIETRQEPHHYVLYTADGRIFTAQRVVVATGPWITSGPGAELSRQQNVQIKKVAALQIDCSPRQNTPVLYFVDEDAFLLPAHEEDRFWFSFTSTEWGCHPQSSNLRITNEDRALALSVLGRYGLDYAQQCNGARVFCDAYSPDRAPLVSNLAHAPDFVIAGACSGSGFRLAPSIASAAIRLLACC